MKSLGRISFAPCGLYDEVIAHLLEGFGWEVVRPPPITDQMIQTGVRYSPEMICFPYKVTLGSIIHLLESGVEDFITYNSQGFCRFTHFSSLYRETLTRLGFRARLHEIDRNSLLSSLRELSGNRAGVLRTARILVSSVRRLFAAEQAEEGRFGGQPFRVMLVGEAYSVVVPEMNFHLRQELLGRGISTMAPALLSHYFRKKFHLLWDSDIDRRARKMLNGPISGCAFESLSNSLCAGLEGFHGIVHLYPLTCMPETTVKPLIEAVAQEFGLPLLTLEIDENLSRLNVQTRIETFAEMVRASGRPKNRG